MCAWRSGAPRSARSAHDSQSWWARRRRLTGPGTTARWRACPAASPGTSPVRAAGHARPGKRAGHYLASVAGMELSFARCFVIVHDPELALDFYRDALGLELRDDVARDDFRWLTVGAASQPDVAIILTNYLSGSPADGDALAALIAKGALNGVHF